MPSEGTGQGELSQSTRWGSLRTELGKDKLVLSRFEGTEALSELFDFRADAISKDANVDFDKLLGTEALVSIQSGHQGVKRNFHALIAKARWTGSAAGLHTYRLQLRPWFWLLTRTSNCRIFSNKTVVEIIEKVFAEYDFAKFKTKLTQSYPKLEYCVQYRESDFDFVSRLMEEFGIYYFFEHSEDEHCMHLVDAASCHQPKAGGATLNFFAAFEAAQQGMGEQDLLHEWTPCRSLRTGKFSMNSYDFKKPKADLLGDKESAAKYSHGKLEHYDFNWRHLEKSQGKDFAHVRLEAEQARDKIYSAAGSAVTCAPGTLMKLDKHPEKSFNAEYLVVQAEHSYRSEGYIAESKGGERYEGSYQFQPSNVVFRAPQVTEKPRIYGPQTALVASDEVDENARIKVLFPWDRDSQESRWVRISHGWSGNQWGDIKIPREGMEVVVEYLDGDPDYPLVTGCVYNGINQPPYPLPANKTISGTKSKTYNGTGYNEFIFDDRDGAELVRLHAEKNMEGTIKNNETRTVGNNVQINVGNMRSENIGNSWTVQANTMIQFTVGNSTLTMTPFSIMMTTPALMMQGTEVLLEQSGSLSMLASNGFTMVNSQSATLVDSQGLTLIGTSAPVILLHAVMVPG